MIDLRSDTVTKPTAEMRQIMLEAEVGDDVFGEDPSVNALQDKVARMFGMEAGLFVSSGTMGNQLGIHVLSEPGDEVLIDETGHIFNYEATAAAHLSSVMLRPLNGNNGILTPGLIESSIRGGAEWEPFSRIIALENTTNKGGGCCYSRENLQAIRELANRHNLLIHLDGARIWNACTRTGIDFDFFGGIADTLSVCFSKGLGAPVGSMLMSSKERIVKAHRMRKMLGGGMRQIGMLAAAADYAIDKHYPLLADDHRRARSFAGQVADCGRLSINLDRVETNIIIFDVNDEPAVDALSRLREKDVFMSPFGPKTIRATFHFQIGDEDLSRTNRIMKELFS